MRENQSVLNSEHLLVESPAAGKQKLTLGWTGEILPQQAQKD
jgi:hypothetical protein